MDKQIELKAKIGEIQLQLEQLQSQANTLVEMKKRATTQLMQMMQRPAPISKPEEKPVKKK